MNKWFRLLIINFIFVHSIFFDGFGQANTDSLRDLSLHVVDIIMLAELHPKGPADSVVVFDKYSTDQPRMENYYDKDSSVKTSRSYYLSGQTERVYFFFQNSVKRDNFHEIAYYRNGKIHFIAFKSDSIFLMEEFNQSGDLIITQREILGEVVDGSKDITFHGKPGLSIYEKGEWIYFLEVQYSGYSNTKFLGIYYPNGKKVKSRKVRKKYEEIMGVKISSE